jgi:hypothetical protein
MFRALSIMNWDLLFKSISLIADVMTLIGVSGIVTWSIFHRESRLADKVLEIFAFSIKMFFCLLLLAPFLMLFHPMSFFSRLFLTGVFEMPIDLTRQWWDSTNPVPYVISHLFTGLIVIPLYVVTCACVLLWSFSPLSHLFRKFRRGKGDPNIEAGK